MAAERAERRLAAILAAAVVPPTLPTGACIVSVG